MLVCVSVCTRARGLLLVPLLSRAKLELAFEVGCGLGWLFPAWAAFGLVGRLKILHIEYYVLLRWCLFLILSSTMKEGMIIKKKKKGHSQRSET